MIITKEYVEDFFKKVLPDVKSFLEPVKENSYIIGEADSLLDNLRNAKSVDQEAADYLLKNLPKLRPLIETDDHNGVLMSAYFLTVPHASNQVVFDEQKVHEIPDLIEVFEYLNLDADSTPLFIEVINKLYPKLPLELRVKYLPEVSDDNRQEFFDDYDDLNEAVFQNESGTSYHKASNGKVKVRSNWVINLFKKMSDDQLLKSAGLASEIEFNKLLKGLGEDCATRVLNKIYHKLTSPWQVSYLPFVNDNDFNEFLDNNDLNDLVRAPNNRLPEWFNCIVERASDEQLLKQSALINNYLKKLETENKVRVFDYVEGKDDALMENKDLCNALSDEKLLPLLTSKVGADNSFVSHVLLTRQDVGLALRLLEQKKEFLEQGEYAEPVFNKLLDNDFNGLVRLYSKLGMSTVDQSKVESFNGAIIDFCETKDLLDKLLKNDQSLLETINRLVLNFDGSDPYLCKIFDAFVFNYVQKLKEPFVPPGLRSLIISSLSDDQLENLLDSGSFSRLTCESAKALYASHKDFLLNNYQKIYSESRDNLISLLNLVKNDWLNQGVDKDKLDEIIRFIDVKIQKPDDALLNWFDDNIEHYELFEDLIGELSSIKQLIEKDHGYDYKLHIEHYGWKSDIKYKYASKVLIAQAINEGLNNKTLEKVIFDLKIEFSKSERSWIIERLLKHPKVTSEALPNILNFIKKNAKNINFSTIESRINEIVRLSPDKAIKILKNINYAKADLESVNQLLTEFYRTNPDQDLRSVIERFEVNELSPFLLNVIETKTLEQWFKKMLKDPKYITKSIQLGPKVIDDLVNNYLQTRDKDLYEILVNNLRGEVSDEGIEIILKSMDSTDKFNKEALALLSKFIDPDKNYLINLKHMPLVINNLVKEKNLENKKVLADLLGMIYSPEYTNLDLLLDLRSKVTGKRLFSNNLAEDLIGIPKRERETIKLMDKLVKGVDQSIVKLLNNLSNESAKIISLNMERLAKYLTNHESSDQTAEFVRELLRKIAISDKSKEDFYKRYDSAYAKLVDNLLTSKALWSDEYNVKRNALELTSLNDNFFNDEMESVLGGKLLDELGDRSLYYTKNEAKNIIGRINAIKVKNPEYFANGMNLLVKELNQLSKDDLVNKNQVNSLIKKLGLQEDDELKKIMSLPMIAYRLAAGLNELQEDETIVEVPLTRKEQQELSMELIRFLKNDIGERTSDFLETGYVPKVEGFKLESLKPLTNNPSSKVFNIKEESGKNHLIPSKIVEHKDKKRLCILLSNQSETPEDAIFFVLNKLREEQKINPLVKKDDKEWASVIKSYEKKAKASTVKEPEPKPKPVTEPEVIVEPNEEIDDEPEPEPKQKNKPLLA